MIGAKLKAYFEQSVIWSMVVFLVSDWHILAFCGNAKFMT